MAADVGGTRVPLILITFLDKEMQSRLVYSRSFPVEALLPGKS